MDNSERIAIALERIADALEANSSAAAPRRANAHTSTSDAILAALEAHRGALIGRMTAQQVADVIGIRMDHSQRVAFGNAMQRFGAHRLKSGSQRSYQFGAAPTAHKVPQWFMDLLASKREQLRGTMTMHAVADIAGIPKTPAKLSEIRHNLIAMGYHIGGGMFAFS